jgi:hypothetical protein
MRSATLALALVSAAALPLRAEENGRATARHGSSDQASVVASSGSFAFELFFNSLAFGLDIAALEDAAAPPPRQPVVYRQRDSAEAAWDAPRRKMQAREGLLVSLGVGGGRVPRPTTGGGGGAAFDGDFRLGYGFSDRFQLFMDFSGDMGRYPQYPDFASWMFTIRGQTVLMGDRAGNGLSVNFGVGVGGVDYDNGAYSGYSSPTGLALGGGLSYDARLSPSFALSPEFFVNWHQIPSRPGFADDVSSVYGVRLNFHWYLK